MVKWRVFEAPVGQKRTPAPGKNGRGDEKSGAFSQQPGLGSSFIANTNFLFSRARKRARAHEASDWPRDSWPRERCSPARSFPGSALRNRGWGFGARHQAKRPTTMGSARTNFFPLFDYGGCGPSRRAKKSYYFLLYFGWKLEKPAGKSNGNQIIQQHQPGSHCDSRLRTAAWRGHAAAGEDADPRRPGPHLYGF